MAVTDIEKVRPYHIRLLIAEYDTGGLWDGDTVTGSGTVDTSAAITAAEAVITDIGNEITSDKATAIGNTDSAIEAFKALWPFASQAAFESAVDALKGTVSGAINGDIQINVSAYQGDIDDAIDNNIDGSSISVPIKAALEQAVANYDTAIIAALPNPCPECSTTGLRPVYDSSGVATLETEESALCDGFGYTSTLYVASQPNFIPSP